MQLDSLSGAESSAGASVLYPEFAVPISTFNFLQNALLPPPQPVFHTVCLARSILPRFAVVFP